MTTLVNAYTDVATFKSWTGMTATTYDTTLIPLVINATSRAVDTFCHQRFWLDGSAVARTFNPQSLYYLDLRQAGVDAYNPGIGDITSLVVKTDSAGDGTYETTWQTSDYQLGPVDAAYASPEAQPWTNLRAVGSQTFPLLVATALTRYNKVQVTAKWGWPAIPDSVTMATLIKAAKLFGRKDSPQGLVAGSSDFGPVRISRYEDPDVVELLTGYTRNSVLVA